MKKIGIQTPCSENWNAMTPTEKGAFCQKCAFEVHDFTHSTSEEIRETLVEAMSSRVCARMTVDQEKELRNDYLRWSSAKSDVRRMSLFAFVVVFGLSLFSCNNETDREAFLNLQRSILEVATGFHYERPEMIQGEIGPIQEELMGKVEEVEIESIEIEEVVMGMVAPVQVEHKVIEPEELYQLKGDVALPTDFYDYVKETSTEVRTEESNAVKVPTIKVYPNPATTYTSIEVNVPKSQSYTISILDQQGLIVKKTMYGKLEEGIQYVDVDLSTLAIGTYFVYVTTKGHKLQEKLIKF